MITIEELTSIGHKSATLDWTNPKAIQAEVTEVSVNSRKKFAVIWKAADGVARAYGIIGGRTTVNPLMSKRRAGYVANYLLNR